MRDGGGGIGTLLLGDLGTREDIVVKLLTSHPDRWSREIEVFAADGSIVRRSRIDQVSDNPRDVITGSHVVISTVPSHVLPSTVRRISPYVESGMWVGVVPGSGGSEFYCMDLVNRGCVLFGFQRVHGIARPREYGKSVYDLGRKDKLFLAAIPAGETSTVCSVMEDLFGVPCVSLPNYLNVTLSPSNALLRPARPYSLFKDYREGQYWPRQIGFYSEWTDEASEILLGCDAELQETCRRAQRLGLDLSGVRSLREHYESPTAEALTRKIRSIVAFKDLKTPMVQTESGWIPDLESRYFTEDIPGCVSLKPFGQVLSFL